MKKKKEAAKKKKLKKVIAKKIVVVEKKSSLFEGVHKTKIRIVGIGGGGGSIISGIASKIKKVDFVAANTDARALKILSDKIKKVQFGENLTKGLGTGMNVELGELSANEDREKIKKIFEGQDLCILIACLGGGTASGAVPVFAKMAKNSGCLTYGIFTLPFAFEGEKKAIIARETLQKIKPFFNIFSVIPNEGIFQIIDKNTPLQGALSAINDRLIQNLDGLIEMITSVGLVNIDFADLRTILSGYGKLTYLNTVELEENQEESSSAKLISTPLYPYTFKGAKGILYNIIGGKNLSLAEVKKISSVVSDSVNRNAKIIFGLNQNGKSPKKLKITLLAVGCVSEIREKPVAKKIVAKKALAELPNKIKKKKKKSAKAKPIAKKETEIPIVRVGENPSKETEAALMADNTKIRRSALEVKKVIEAEEKELLEKESLWETPAILRKRK